MADEVQITFGAKIDDLVSGVKQVNQHLHSVQEKVGDVGTHGAGAFTQLHSLLGGLSSPLMGVRQSLGELAEGFAVAFGVEKIVSTIEKMAELGTQTARTAAILGINTNQVGQLKVVAESTGTTLESLAMTTERLALNIQRSGTSATAPAALALSKLGLSAKDFIGLSADQYLLKIADAASKFNMNFNMSQALMALGGRGMQSLIPIIAEGREGIEHLQKSASDVGGVLSTQTVHALESVHKNLVLLKAAVEGSTAAMVARFAPAINSIIEAMTKWVVTSSQVSASGRIFESMLDQMAYMITSLVITAVKGAAALKAFFSLDWEGVKAAWESHELEQQKALKTHMDNMAKIAEDGKKKLSGAMGPGEHGHGAPDKPDVGAIGYGAADAVSAAMKAADGEVKALQDGLTRQKVLLEQGLAQFRLTESEKVEAVRSATDKANALEMAVLQNELKIGQMSAAQRQEVLNKISALESRYATETVKINGEAVAAVQKQWMQIGDALQSSFNSQLRGLLAGTTKFGQAFKSILGDMIIYFIQACEKMLVQWAIKTATEVTTTEAGEAAKTAAVAAGTGTQMAAQLPLILKNIAASIGSVFAGVSAFLAPAIGPAAPAAAAGVAAGVEATAMSLVGSAEQGAYEVTGGLWQLHPRETVLPAPAAQAFRDMAEGGGGFGGGGVHFHGMMIDGPSIAGLFKSYAGVMAKALNGHAAMNPSTR